MTTKLLNRNSIRYLKLSVSTLLLFLCISSLTAQVNRNPEDEEFYCKNKDYKFLFEGKFSLEKRRGKAYVCPKNLPAPITIVDAANQLPVLENITWTVNGNLSTEVTHTLQIKAADFVNGKVDLNCTFTESATGDLVDLDFNISTEIRLKFKESAKKYQYDENDEQKYITSYGGTELLNTPWNFLEANQYDVLEAKVNKKKHFLTVNDITADHSALDITPDALSAAAQDITFEFESLGSEIVAVNGCSDTDPELLLFVEEPKTYSIQFIRVCETDDDVQTNPVGAVLADPFGVCISGGVDMTIDRMEDGTFLKGDDMIYQDLNTGIWYVGAGSNLTCETKAHPASSPDCPPVFKTAPSITATNDILGKIGIKFNNLGVITVYANYDVYDENGIMSREEQKWFHDIRHGGFIHLPITEVFLVDDLGIGSTGAGKVQGRATADQISGGLDGKNSVSIDVNDAVKETLVHEIGHAKWGLLHPGSPGTGQFNIDDTSNFMHGVSNQVKYWNIRRYQFHLMH